MSGLEEWAFPPVCVLCGARGAAPGFDLCAGCEADLPVWDSSPAVPLRAGGGALDAMWSAFAYEFPVDGLVRDLKFAGHLAYAAVLGVACSRRLQAEPWIGGLDALLPVPLHPARLRTRGFNQALEIARPLSRSLRLPLLHGVVRRCLPTQPQTELSAEARLANLRGAFEVLRPVQGLRIALLDDVLTTGATLGELAQALKRAGALEVVGITAARAP